MGLGKTIQSVRIKKKFQILTSTDCNLKLKKKKKF